MALIWAVQWKKRSRAKKRRGRGKVRRRGKGVDLEIPLDLQMEILARLPAKSLMRFKCVSKVWSCLIRSRYLSNLYLRVPRQPRLYMSLLDHSNCDSMEVCHDPGKSLLLSLSSSSSSLDPDLTMQGMGGHEMMVHRGLILYTVCRKACIYNPATRQSVTLPAVKSDLFAREEAGEESHEKCVSYFLGHDPVLDQYKVICNVVILPFTKIASEHWVFVLEAGGSWKKIECDEPNLASRLGLCINGVIYYLGCTYAVQDVVFCFDVRSEELNMIQAPPHLGESVGFIEYGGKPTIFDHTHLGQNGLVDLWVLEDGGKWSKKSQVLQPCQMHLLVNDNVTEFTVECTTQNSEIVLQPRPMLTPCFFLYYDLQKNDLRKVNVNRIWDQDGFGMKYSYVKQMDKSESIMHLET